MNKNMKMKNGGSSDNGGPATLVKDEVSHENLQEMALNLKCRGFEVYDPDTDEGVLTPSHKAKAALDGVTTVIHFHTEAYKEIYELVEQRFGGEHHLVGEWLAFKYHMDKLIELMEHKFNPYAAVGVKLMTYIDINRQLFHHKKICISAYPYIQSRDFYSLLPENVQRDWERFMDEYTDFMDAHITGKIWDF